MFEKLAGALTNGLEPIEQLRCVLATAFVKGVVIMAAAANQRDPTCAGRRILSPAGFNLCTVRGGHLRVNPIVVAGTPVES